LQGHSRGGTQVRAHFTKRTCCFARFDHERAVHFPAHVNDHLRHLRATRYMSTQNAEHDNNNNNNPKLDQKLPSASEVAMPPPPAPSLIT
jgi:hypothetical protein